MRDDARHVATAEKTFLHPETRRFLARTAQRDPAVRELARRALAEPAPDPHRAFLDEIARPAPTTEVGAG